MQVTKFAEPQITASSEPKKHWSLATRIALGLLIAFFALLLSAGVAIAKTGFFSLPWLSKIVKTTSEPARRVTVLPSAPKFEQTLESQVSGAINRYARTRNKEDQLVKVRLEEGTLTRYLRENVALISKDISWKLDPASAQIAIDSEQVELYLQGKQSERVQSIRVSFIPKVREGVPTVDVRGIWIGSLPVPSSLANMALRLINKQAADFVKQVSAIGKIDSFELRDGTIIGNFMLTSGAANSR